jgi:hypothetical protein
MQSAFNRAGFLAGLSATSALTACASSSAVPAAAGASSGPNASPTIAPPGSVVPTPITHDPTKSDLPSGTPIYLYIIGLVGSTFYRLDASGTPHALSVSDNTIPALTFPGSNQLSASAASAIAQNYPSAWADYSIQVSQTAPSQISLAKINTSNIPGLGTGTSAFSGRIYVSVGIPKLPFTVTSGGFTAPIFTAPPGYLTLFDWIEFSYDSLGNFNGNTTQVDQFGFSLMLNGTPGGTVQGQQSSSRPTIMNAFAAAAEPFGPSLLVPIPSQAASAYPAGLTYLRAISPKTVIGNSNTGTLSTYFASAVTNAYNTWQTTPLVTFDTSTGFFTGIVPTSGANAGSLVFSQGNFSTLAALQTANPPVAFVLTGTNPATNVILSYDIWQCANTLASGGAAQKNVEKMIAAAFNRGVVTNSMNDSTCSTTSNGFYPTGGTFNSWAQRFHQVSVNGLAYGFPYDDVCNQNPTIALSSTSSVTITLGKFFS